MTLVVLAIDALDAAQVEHFDIEEYKLKTRGEMETFAHQNPVPHTGEVWPTVATGLGPEDHGITHGGESEWDRRWVEYLSRAAGPFVPMKTRAKVGRLIQRATGADWGLNETDERTIFDDEGRYVHNWPGVHRGEELQRVWRDIEHATEKGMAERQYDLRLLSSCASKLAWVREAVQHKPILVGTHVHALDASGHNYGNNEEVYRRFYNRVAELVAEIKEDMDGDDDMLILSDHGINTSWLEIDTELFNHSWRAYSASTLSSRPKSVFEVKSWIEEHIGPHERAYRQSSEGDEEVEMPEETLRDLGYLS